MRVLGWRVLKKQLLIVQIKKQMLSIQYINEYCSPCLPWTELGCINSFASRLLGDNRFMLCSLIITYFLQFRYKQRQKHLPLSFGWYYYPMVGLTGPTFLIVKEYYSVATINQGNTTKLQNGALGKRIAQRQNVLVDYGNSVFNC